MATFIENLPIKAYYRALIIKGDLSTFINMHESDIISYYDLIDNDDKEGSNFFKIKYKTTIEPPVYIKDNIQNYRSIVEYIGNETYEYSAYFIKTAFCSDNNYVVIGLSDKLISSIRPKGIQIYGRCILEKICDDKLLFNEPAIKVTRLNLRTIEEKGDRVTSFVLNGSDIITRSII